MAAAFCDALADLLTRVVQGEGADIDEGPSHAACELCRQAASLGGEERDRAAALLLSRCSIATVHSDGLHANAALFTQRCSTPGTPAACGAYASTPAPRHTCPLQGRGCSGSGGRNRGLSCDSTRRLLTGARAERSGSAVLGCAGG